MLKQKYRWLILPFLLSVLFSLVSCSGEIDGNEARNMIETFLQAVEDEDYEKAETLLHPACSVDPETYFSGIEKQEELDFGSGITIEKYTGVSASYYHSEVDGSRYEVTAKVKVGSRTVNITVEVVKNDEGYGVYDLKVEA